MAGAAGHILDVFFQKSRLDRKTIVATKAVTQVTGHVYRIIYFGSFGMTFDASIPWWAYAAAIALTVAGTSLAALVLDAHDGRRVPPVEPARHPWRQRHLYRPRAVAGGGAVS